MSNHRASEPYSLPSNRIPRQQANFGREADSDTEERRRSDPSDFVNAVRARDANYARGRNRDAAGRGPPGYVNPGPGPGTGPRGGTNQRDSQSKVGRPSLVEHSESYIRRPRFPPARHGNSWDRSYPATNAGNKDAPRLELPQYYNPRTARHRNGGPAPKPSFSQKVKSFFKRLTAEPVLISPPPTRPVSRSNSFSGTPSRAIAPNQDTRSRASSLSYVDTGTRAMAHPDAYENDMLLRSISMNRERETAKSTIRDEADVEVDLRDETDGNRDGDLEDENTPYNLRRRAQGRAGAGSGEEKRERGRERNESDDETETAASTPGEEKPEAVDGKGGQPKSYRQRRKKAKHRIVYNRDTVDAQQRFILTLSKALLVFGSLSHRIEPQLISVAAIFELPAQFSHVPGCIQVSFGDPDPCATPNPSTESKSKSTSTATCKPNSSQTLFIKASTTLDLGKIHETHKVYRRVVRDEISATEGRKRLEDLLAQGPMYGRRAWLGLTFVQGFILCGTSFGGSLNDMWVAAVLSTMVAFVQMLAARSELSSSGADIFTAAIVAFVARALSLRVPNRIFCFQAISSTSVTGLLPGSLMLSGVLDIASRNIFLGAPKLVTGLLTSLYLGFGLTLGSDIWLRIDKRGRTALSSIAGHQSIFTGAFHGTNATTPADLPLSNLTGLFTFTAQPGGFEKRHTIAGCFRDPNRSWAFRPLPWYSLFALLPVLNLVLSLKRNQPWRTREMPVMIAISCISNAVTQLGNRKFGLSGHPDYAALLGSFIVSLLGNLWSRKFGGTAFTVMLTGIWLLIPTGLSEAGGLAATYHLPGEDEYTASLALARKMISVIIGVMSGVYLSARIVYSFGKRKNSALVTF